LGQAERRGAEKNRLSREAAQKAQEESQKDGVRKMFLTPFF
jgi:hypothetical protein